MIPSVLFAACRHGRRLCNASFSSHAAASAGAAPERKNHIAVRIVESTHLPEQAGVQGFYASATAAFDTCSAVSAGAAVKMVLGKIQKHIPLQQTTFMLLYTSLPKQQCLEALKRISKEIETAGATKTVVAGCTSRRWQPEGEAAGSFADDEGCEEGGVVAHHLTIASAHLPNMTALGFHTTHDSVPLQLPELDEMISTRPPHFLVLTHPTNHRSSAQGYALLSRLENIFPGSAIVGAVANWIRMPSLPPTAVAPDCAIAGGSTSTISGSLADSSTSDSSSSSISSTSDSSSSSGRSGSGKGRRGTAGRASRPAVVGSSDAEDEETDWPLGSLRQGRRRRGRRPPPATTAPAPRFRDAPSLPPAISAPSHLFLGDVVHAGGTVGIALCPDTAGSRLHPSSAAMLVRMTVGGERLGGDDYESPRYMFSAPVRAQLLPTFPQRAQLAHPFDLKRHRPPPQVPDPLDWAPAMVTPPQLGGNISRHSVRQNDKELPILALPKLVLWPAQGASLCVLEPRHLLLLRSCCEQRAVLGIVHEGVGTTARVVDVKEGSQGEVVAHLEGGRRFEYLPGNPRVHTPRASRVLPASFGLTAATVSYIEDHEVLEAEEGRRVEQLAKEACRLLQRGCQEAAMLQGAPQDDQAEPLSDIQAAAGHLHRMANLGREQGLLESVISMSVESSLKMMDIQQAQDVSLWLGGLLTPCVGVRTARMWLRQRSTWERLEEQVQVLQKYECRRDAAVAMLGQGYSHPLTRMLLPLGMLIQAHQEVAAADVSTAANAAVLT